MYAYLHTLHIDMRCGTCTYMQDIKRTNLYYNAGTMIWAMSDEYQVIRHKYTPLIYIYVYVYVYIYIYIEIHKIYIYIYREREICIC